MELIALILILSFGLRGIRSFFIGIKTIRYISHLSKTHISIKDKCSRKIVVLIPCLSEQDKIINTLDYFKEILVGDFILCTITTEKENNSVISTREVINNYLVDEEDVLNIHYPRKNGYMAHQINYAIGYLRSKNLVKEDDYFAIYNADSRPHPHTFKWFSREMCKKDGLKIYQQVAILFKNFNSFRGSYVKRLFLKTFAILQTRFSFSYELPRIIRTNSDNKFISGYSNAHCIGHGLFIENKTLQKLGGLPEDAVTEDLFFGFKVRSFGHKIGFIPYMENADSPTTVFRNLKQKYVWFFGPLYYPYYLLDFVRKHRYIFLKRPFKVLFLAVQGVISAVAWMFSGLLFLAALVLLFVDISIYTKVILLVAIIIYGPLQYFYYCYKYKKLTSLSTNEVVHKNGNLKDCLIISFLSIPAIILHSIPTYFTVLAEIRRVLFGIPIKKNKTES